MAIAILSITLPACSGSQSAPMIPSAGQLSITSADFKRVVAWGSPGKLAVAQCPQNYKVVAGGSASSDGLFVGTGYADSNNTSWIVKPNSSASAESFATCVHKGLIGRQFHWIAATSVSGLAAAQCPISSMLITGYGTGTVDTSWFDPSTSTYWVSGGGNAYASCVRRTAGVVIRHAWNKSQKPKNVYAGCPSGYTVIAGAMGDSQWPGPPLQQHPGPPGNPGKNGYEGWWTFSNALNELTWAACVPTGS